MTRVTIEPLYLDKPDAAEFVALSESTLEQLVRQDKFPKPRELSPRRVGWLVDELRAWAAERPVSTGLPPQNTGARKGRSRASATQPQAPRA